MERTDTVWQSAELGRIFLRGVRGGIPLAAEQIDVLLRLIRAARPKLERFLDLGCGDGILGRAVSNDHPGALGVLLDFSEPMLDAARQACGGAASSGKFEFVLGDLASRDWTQPVKRHAPFAAIVSGFAIHHQPDSRKRELYREIFDLLEPGGIFLNLEHVSSSSPWVESLFDALVIDSLHAFHLSSGSPQSREDVAREYVHRPDKAANILAPVETQCSWLTEIGFQHVDCYMKLFELALFGGVRPDG